MRRTPLAPSLALALASALLAGAGPAAAQDLIPKPDADPQLILTEARELARAGRYEEALQRQIWFRANVLRLDPAMSGVRQSFALSDWADLGRKYPPAQQALVDARDRAVAACRAKGGTSNDFSDVKSINGYLDEDEQTVALFRELDAQKPKLARSCIHYAKSKLAEAGEYALCAKYIPDPESDFGSIRSSYDLMLNNKALNAADPNLRRFAEKHFDDTTGQLIEVLVGAGRKPEAEVIWQKALAVRDVPAIRGAVARAERKVGAARAANPDGK